MSGRHTQGGGPSSPRLGPLIGILLLAALVLVVVILVRGDGDPSSTTTAAAALPTTAAPTSTTTTRPTTTAATSTTVATTTTTEPLAVLAMTEAGLGSIRFGTDADEAIAQLVSVLGDPSEDTGWSAAFETCPGPEVRIVRWVSLQAFFTNGATDWAPQDTEHFFHYGNSITAGGGEVLDLQTLAGIAVGDSIAELKAAYGDAVTVSDDPLFGPLWEVSVGGAGALWGTAGTAADTGLIDSINGGPGCGE